MYLSFTFLMLLRFVAADSGRVGSVPGLGSSPESTNQLYHGDIMLTSKEKANLDKYGNPYGSSLGRAANSQDAKKWPNAVIPYEFDCSVANMESAVSSTMKAIAEWESKTCIRFKKRTNEKAYLQFFRGSGCWGHVGYTENWMSQISIGDNCDFQHVMSHEIGHAIGFWHEQSRPDRDQSIKVLWENVLPGLEDAFAKRTWGSEVIDYGSKYDFASIMHYPFTAFSKNGLPTIQAIASLNGKTPYVEVSPDDVLQTNAMYKCNAVMSKRFADDFESHFKPKPQIVKRANACRDKSQDCHKYKQWGLCVKHADNMVYWCPITCDMCSSDDCMDKKGSCKSWANGGHCQSNPGALRIDCPYTCGFCGRPNTTPSPSPPPPPTDDPATPPPATSQPPSPYKSVGLRCEDKSTRCPSYAASGQCSKSGWVFRTCLLSCKAKCDSKPLQADGGGWKAAAHSGRLYFQDDHKRKLIGGWCPTSRKNQWLKIDLGRAKRLTGIATQGRDVFYEHVQKYEMEFSKDGINWTKYPKVFDGNCDHFTPVLNRFNVQVARYVKVIPVGNQYAWPCLRVELYGCDHQ